MHYNTLALSIITMIDAFCMLWYSFIRDTLEIFATNLNKLLLYNNNSHLQLKGNKIQLAVSYYMKTTKNNKIHQSIYWTCVHACVFTFLKMMVRLLKDTKVMVRRAKVSLKLHRVNKLVVYFLCGESLFGMTNGHDGPIFFNCFSASLFEKLDKLCSAALTK